ncbi:hypothetical protein JXB01_04260, partial [Candidatus Micrarchaeota archaeon]|nr:hypothetical protein [Candidatus Micrarchaeota archaeon]
MSDSARKIRRRAEKKPGRLRRWIVYGLVSAGIILSPSVKANPFLLNTFNSQIPMVDAMPAAQKLIKKEDLSKKIDSLLKKDLQSDSSLALTPNKEKAFESWDPILYSEYKKEKNITKKRLLYMKAWLNVCSNDELTKYASKIDGILKEIKELEIKTTTKPTAKTLKA